MPNRTNFYCLMHIAEKRRRIAIMFSAAVQIGEVDIADGYIS